MATAGNHRFVGPQPPTGDNGERVRRALDELRTTYAARIVALENWRREKEDAILSGRSRKRRRGETDVLCHDAGPSQFQVPGGSDACSTIAVMAAYNFLRRAGRDAREIRWDRVTEAGVLLWQKWKAKHPGDRFHLHALEVFDIEGANGLRKVIELTREVSGLLYGKPEKPFYSLDKALRLLGASGVPSRRAGVFTAQNTTITLLYDGSTFFAFDSHGEAGENKHALLVESSDASGIRMYLRDKFPGVRERTGFEPSLELDRNSFFFAVFEPTSSGPGNPGGGSVPRTNTCASGDVNFSNDPLTNTRGTNASSGAFHSGSSASFTTFR